MPIYTIEWPDDTHIGLVAGKHHESLNGIVAEYTAAELRTVIDAERARREAVAGAALDVWRALPAQYGDTRSRHPQAWLADARGYLAAHPQDRKTSAAVGKFMAAEKAAWDGVEAALRELEAVQ